MINKILKRYWGYDNFRPLQEEIIRSVLSGRDTLGLMPTGGGKSITFQVPAMALDGLTLVITPLISLMKDQVDNLKKRRIKAVYLYSGMTMRESTIAREQLINGKAKLLYVSPEKLRNQRFLQELKQMNLRLVVIDEAHCISQWGYDFRPAYLNIGQLRKLFPDLPMLALTATATPEVEDDIVRLLGMRNEKRLRMSFSRSNLNYIVRPAGMKIHDIFHILSRTQGSAIVYVRSRKRTREISEYLESMGISATYYHAGLDFEKKAERQTSWQRGETRVIVATNAFGMGIDKPDVRIVIHYDFPPSLEEYYQEAGRAGRDGKKSYAVLLTLPSDTGVLRRRVSNYYPPRDEIKKVYERVCNFLHVGIGEGYDRLIGFDLDKFCETFSYRKDRCLSSLNLLHQAGYIEYIEETDRQSRVQILLEREELYNLQGLSPSAEKVLSALLREYPGIFADYVFIRELILEQRSGCNSEGVYEALLELGRHNVLHYIPRSRTPYVYFPTSREETRYLMIGKNIYEERREVMIQRIEAVIDYGFSKKGCREARMLAYFGEKADQNCGRCDLCRESKPRDFNGKLAIEILLEYIKKSEHGAALQIMLRDLRIPAKEAQRLLVYLENEGYVRQEDGVYYAIK